MLSENSSVLSQKQERHLCLIQPSIDLTAEKMTLTAEGMYAMPGGTVAVYPGYKVASSL